ncbi:MAG: chorismate synthase [Bacteroidota bacterium]|nr:chorismate synthase [Bacteroidota bacterium]MDP4234367.1 chorismate synthase [Bacteroidota bacterium]MDP4243300.1 chorismate synthase [Bacteroidota bacterium]MDP4287985.1 chorismate synthase [Bacteroidota bacterium]
MGRLRYLTAGESHGQCLTGTLDGMPSGLSLVAERDINPALHERQRGHGRSHRQQIESDSATITSGVRNGVTTGAPIAITIQNKDWQRWKEQMAIEPNDVEPNRVTIPRPGHADLAGGIKYGHTDDLRNILERASARETAMRVAIGAIANTLLRTLGIESIAFVKSIGTIEDQTQDDPFAFRTRLATSAVRVFDEACEAAVVAEIDKARSDGDTLGGIVECRFRGVPLGIGSHVQSDRKLDGLLAQAAMSIQAVKAVEIGAGIRAAHARGSSNHDAIVQSNGSIARSSNNAGGIEGGMSNGEDIIVRAAMKPISTLMRPLQSIDLATGEATKAHIERSDVCAVPALAVILENVVALTLTSELLETFGGDTLVDLLTRVEERRDRMKMKPAIAHA